MPLESGAGREAFEHNIKAELAAGKPKAQALAIAYAKARSDSLPAENAEKLEGAVQRLDGLNRRFDALTARSAH